VVLDRLVLKRDVFVVKDVVEVGGEFSLLELL